MSLGRLLLHNLHFSEWAQQLCQSGVTVEMTFKEPDENDKRADAFSWKGRLVFRDQAFPILLVDQPATSGSSVVFMPCDAD